MDGRENLIGIGLYTPSEAARLIRVPAARITRWLKGHKIKGKTYEPLWAPQIDLADGHIYLGFRDLMEMRTAHAFMERGISAVAIRRAIQIAQEIIGEERPLSTTRFKTDGYSIFLEIADENGDPKLLDLFRSQFAFKKIIEQSLSDVDFDGIAPGRWWPASRKRGVLIDPNRAFGQPIDERSGVPTSVLASAVAAEGSMEAVSKIWQVPVLSVRRAVEFEEALQKNAA